MDYSSRYEAGYSMRTESLSFIRIKPSWEGIAIAQAELERLVDCAKNQILSVAGSGITTYRE